MAYFYGSHTTTTTALLMFLVVGLTVSNNCGGGGVYAQDFLGARRDGHNNTDSVVSSLKQQQQPLPNDHIRRSLTTTPEAASPYFAKVEATLKRTDGNPIAAETLMPRLMVHTGKFLTDAVASEAGGMPTDGYEMIIGKNMIDFSPNDENPDEMKTVAHGNENIFSFGNDTSNVNENCAHSYVVESSFRTDRGDIENEVLYDLEINFIAYGSGVTDVESNTTTCDDFPAPDLSWYFIGVNMRPYWSDPFCLGSMQFTPQDQDDTLLSGVTSLNTCPGVDTWTVTTWH